MRKRIKVTTRCVADRYSAPNEKIVEFSSDVGGGLVSFRIGADNHMHIQVYRTDPNITVSHDQFSPGPVHE